MTEYPGRRRNRPDEPTDESTSDPVPTGEDILNRHRNGHETPRRYEEAVKEHDSSSDESTLKSHI
jgi:hypothetical protein